VNVPVLEPFPQVRHDVSAVMSRRGARRYDLHTRRVSEDDPPGRVLLAAESTLVHQPVMMPAEQHKVVETGLAAVGPVSYVVAIDEMPVRAAREAALPVPGLERAPHGRRDDPRLAADRQWFAIVIADDPADRGIAADTFRRFRGNAGAGFDHSRHCEASRRPRQFAGDCFVASLLAMTGVVLAVTGVLLAMP